MSLNLASLPVEIFPLPSSSCFPVDPPLPSPLAWGEHSETQFTVPFCLVLQPVGSRTFIALAHELFMVVVRLVR